MNPKNWGDDHTHDDDYERRLHEREIEDKKQKHKHTESLHAQKEVMFDVLKKYIVWMFVVGYVFVAFSIFRPSTQGAIAAGIALMVPLVIVLAMIRVLYDKQGSDQKAMPSIVLNVGKELAGVLKSYIKSSGGAG